MKYKYLGFIFLLITISKADQISNPNIFAVAPIDVTLPVIHLGPKGPKIVGSDTHTMIGCFYNEHAPIYDGTAQRIEIPRHPSQILVNLSIAAKNKNIDDILVLFTPESRLLMQKRLEHQESGDLLKNALFSYEKISLVAFWMDTRTIGFAYLKSGNNDQVFPVLLQFKDNRFYLLFAEYYSNISNQLDLVYSNRMSDKIKISPPNPQNAAKIIADFAGLKL